MVDEILHTEILKSEARELGFAHCGVAPADPVAQDYVLHYRQWLEAGCQAEMHYLENHLEKRFDPRLLVDGTRSVVSLAMNYCPDRVQEGLAWYAQGKDYHDVLRERMQQLMERLGLQGRCFVDTAPVPERYWAWRCGLGWIGRHHQLVIPQEGSTFFLGELFVTARFDVYDTPMKSRCGGCTRCLDACPTGAISPTSTCFDSRKCISYLTIENRGELPDGLASRMGQTFYGCDRCLKACPHLKVEPTGEGVFRPSEELLTMQPDDWRGLTRERYQVLFKGSAVKRAKYEGLMRNIRACLGEETG